MQHTWRSDIARVRRALIDPRLVIIIGLALLAGTLAYQAPAQVVIPIGWLGDRLFLRASEGQAAGDALSFYGDEITDHARSGRSRWTHAGADVAVAGLGPGDLTITLRVQGWPHDVLNQGAAQPVVQVLADGQSLGELRPSAEWADYRFDLPAGQRAGDDLVLTLRASDVFTGTRAFADPRPKGVRVESVAVMGHESPSALISPARMPLVALALNGVLWLLTLLALTGRPNLSFVLTTLYVAMLAAGLALARGWMVALFPWLLVVGALALAYAWRAMLLGYGLRLVQAYGRGQALNYGLIVAGVLWVMLAVTWACVALAAPAIKLFQATFPDSLITGMLAICLLGMAMVLGREGLPRLTQSLVAALGSRRGAWVLLALLLLVWGGYLGSVIAIMPYVGHADYADNAVVARNLIAGRGWVVDYVSQFYQLYDGITRPQETWPLMQPVWIAPFFALFGAQAWAAKLPNLLFMLALGGAVALVGSRLWNRRVGLTAATLALTSHLFFKLVIYATSDLAFVLFAFGAIWLLYQVFGQRREGRAPISASGARWRLGGSALLTGLMILQKPGSGGIMAVGMGVWLLVMALRGADRAGGIRARAWALRPVLAWGLVAALLVAPLVARNLATFGKLYYSTEGYDAWVLEYTNWDRIYAVYTPELGGEGPPDRSWILRWGFDRTLTKIVRQAEAVRDYLIPGWQVPGGLGWLVGRSDKDLRLLFDMGAWLTLLGALGMLASHRRLLTLLLMAFGPYTLFLTIYWHTNEERYFVALLPWLAILAAAALWRGYDRVAAIGSGRWAPLGLVMALAAFGLVVAPSWPQIDQKVRQEPQLYAADLDLYQWLRASTPAESVMMTRNPWQLNWQSERGAVMIPYTTDRATLLRLAQHYQVRFLVLDSLQRPEPEVQRMLIAMVEDPALGFRRVYQTPVYVAEYRGSRKEIQAEVYAFPDDYGGE